MDLEKVEEVARRLAPVPEVVTALARLVSSPTWTAEEVEALVMQSPALAGRILSLANSAAFGSPREVRAIREAVIRLGAGPLLALAFASTLGARLGRPIPEYGLGRESLFHHSVAAAVVAELLPRSCREQIPADAHAAALLNDLGKLSLAPLLGRSLQGALLSAQARGAAEWEAEMEVLGVHHGEVGAYITQRWELPDTLVKAIQFHHHPELDDTVVTAATHVATTLANELLDGDDYPISACALERLGLGERDLDRVRVAATARLSPLITAPNVSAERRRRRETPTLRLAHGLRP